MSQETVKTVIGLALGLAIGFGCRALGIPAPAPGALIGALLVVAMTLGYVLVDRRLTRPAQMRAHCAGPDAPPPAG